MKWSRQYKFIWGIYFSYSVPAKISILDFLVEYGLESLYLIFVNKKFMVDILYLM